VNETECIDLSQLTCFIHHTTSGRKRSCQHFYFWRNSSGFRLFFLPLHLESTKFHFYGLFASFVWLLLNVRNICLFICLSVGILCMVCRQCSLIKMIGIILTVCRAGNHCRMHDGQLSICDVGRQTQWGRCGQNSTETGRLGPTHAVQRLRWVSSSVFLFFTSLMITVAPYGLRGFALILLLIPAVYKIVYLLTSLSTFFLIYFIYFQKNRLFPFPGQRS